jgi:hypothetical protein
MRDVHVSGPGALNFVSSELRGLDLRGVTEVLVSGCDLTVELGVRQTAEDSFKKVTLTKLNFFDGCKLVLERPRGSATKDEKLKLDKPFFGAKEGGKGIEDLKAIAAHVQDGTDVEDGTIRAWVQNPGDRKHQLVDYQTLRMRVPPLK